MSNEIRPFSTVLHELNTLVGSKSSGFLFLVTNENAAATIRLRNGTIEEVSFANRHNDEAVQLLMKVPGARARFQPSVMAAIPSKYGPLSAASLEWLMSAPDASATAPGSATHAAPPAAISAITTPDLRPKQRPVVEAIALTYFGPIAGLLCEEAFGESRDIERILVQIASNLAERAEADRFLAEARKAIARIT